MALSVKQGTITEPGSTGTQATTGVGFQPKVLFLYGNDMTADGTHADSIFCMGWAVSSSDRRYNAIASDDGVTTSVCRSRHSADKCFGIINPAGTVLCEADFTTFGSDGFTLDWTTVSATGRRIHYLALGGTDIANVAGGSITSPTSNTTASTTTPGFTPDAVFCMSTDQASAGTKTDCHFALGWGTSASARGVQMMAGAHDLGDSETAKYNNTTGITGAHNTSSGSGVKRFADLQSMDANGFTLNFTTTNATAALINFLCIKGPAFKVGVDTQRTSAGSQDTTGIGFTPVAVVLMGSGATSTGSSASIANSIGSGDASAYHCCWVGDQNAQGTMRADSRADALIYEHYTSGTGAPTIQAVATLSALASDQFTLTYSQADANARRFLYLAIGAGSAGTQDIAPSGIATAYASGTAVIGRGAVTVAPSGISTGYASGTASVGYKVAPSAIASAEAFGTATIGRGVVSIAPSGIATAYNSGTATITTGAVTVAPSAITSGQAFGTATITTGSLNIAPSSITTGYASGTATITTGAVTVAPSGIASAQAFGTASVTTGALNLSPSSIASAEAIGTAIIGRGAVNIAPTGITSAGAIGTPSLGLFVSPSAITSAQAFGTATISPGVATITPSGIATAAAFGTTVVSQPVGDSVITINAANRARSFSFEAKARVVQFGGKERSFVFSADE